MVDGDIQDTDLYIAITDKIPIVTTAHQPTIDGTANTVYFLVNAMNIKWIVGNKVTRYSGRRSHSDKRGIVYNVVTVKKGILLGKDINRLAEKILNGGHTQSHALLYLMIKLNSPGDGATQSTATHMIFKDRNENDVWYLKGHLKVADIDIIAGTDIYQIKFSFMEITSGT